MITKRSPGLAGPGALIDNALTCNIRRCRPVVNRLERAWQSTPETVLHCDIAVFAADDYATIQACLESIDHACHRRPGTRVSVLLNGSTDAMVETVKQFRAHHCRATVLRFPERDKINAINWYFQTLRADTPCHVCVDGHTTISPDAVDALCDALENNKEAVIASGVPTSGRSADWMRKALLAGGHNVGNLRAIRRSFVDRLVAAGLKLPVELYRGDGLIGSMAAHDLDPLNMAWNSARMIGVAGATFKLRHLSPLRVHDIRKQYAREVRQARGKMENAAIKSLIYHLGYEGLPDNATDMVNAWLTDNKPATRSPRRAYFTWRARRALENGPRISGHGPEYEYTIEPSGTRAIG